MKYYEILYNSSQSSRSGSVGLGIRSLTEGMPSEYIAAVEESKAFERYQSGSFKNLYPSDLLADASKILAYPVQYSYTTVTLSDGRKLYLLRRSVPLGFDYAFYLNGNATRLGNYGVHVLVFEQQPDASAFDIFYDLPAAGSTFFIPRDRTPDVRNEELKRLMTDRMPDLPPRDFQIRTLHEAPTTPEAYHLFFHLIEARRQQKSLVVRCVDSRKHILIADLYRLLAAHAPHITFTSGNYSSIIDTSVDITFLNEYFTAPLAGENPAYLCCDAATPPQTEEYAKYAEELRAAKSAGDEATIQKLSDWLLSGNYASVKGASAQTSRAFFHLCYIPELFTSDDLRNRELLGVIARHIPATSNRMDTVRERMAGLILRTLEIPDPAPFIETIRFVQEIRRAGIETQEVIARVRPACSAYMLASPARLAEIFGRVEQPTFAEYVLADRFIERCDDFIPADEIRPHLLKIYRYFFRDPKTAAPYLLSRLVQKLRPEELATLLKDAEPNAGTRQQTYIATIKWNPDYAIPLWDVAQADLGNGIRADLYAELRDFIDRPDFSQIFYYAFRTGTFGSPIAAIERNAEIMRRNPRYSDSVCREEPKNQLYKHLFRSFIGSVEARNADRIAASIDEAIIKTPLYHTGCVNEWVHLYNILKGNAEKSNDAYRIARRMKDPSYFHRIAYERLESLHDAAAIGAVVHDLADLKLLDKTDFYLETVAKYPHAKQTHCLGMLFREKAFSFKTVLERLNELDFYRGDDVLVEYYGGAYKSYRRNQRIKNFLKKLFGFSDKPESSAGHPAPKRRTTNSGTRRRR